jgi:hypothetical protein
MTFSINPVKLGTAAGVGMMALGFMKAHGSSSPTPKQSDEGGSLIVFGAAIAFASLALEKLGKETR